MTKRLRWTVLGLLWVVFATDRADSAPLNQEQADQAQAALAPLALFNRCYSHLTGRIVSRRHPLSPSISTGVLDPIDACMDVLRSADIKASGELEREDADARLLLKTFHNFHRTWFPSDNFFQALPIGDCYPNMSSLHDQGEPALHVTRSLFAPSASFSEVATGDTMYFALRQDPTGAPLATAPLATSDAAGNLSVTTYPATQRGELYGVRAMKDDSTRMAIRFTANASKNESQAFAHHGGGVVGSSAFLLLNFGRQDHELNDGGKAMPRRWAKAVLSDLLCRDVPPIRQDDAKAYVQESTTASTPPFRLSRNCMACHAGLDPLAGTARNKSMQSTICRNELDGSMHIHDHAVSKGRDVTLVDSDPDFAFRPPDGRLFYRSYDGTLVNHLVTGLKDLGQKISETNDFYVCAASRYFNYFTGIKVNLQDLEDPTSEKLTRAELTLREQVIKLGLDLKQHQRLDKLIEAIIRSDLYSRTSLRDVEVVK